jgi:hypothetical protein
MKKRAFKRWERKRGFNPERRLTTGFDNNQTLKYSGVTVRGRSGAGQAGPEENRLAH